MFHELPPELFQIILEFASVKRRNGEYISQIPTNDARYGILKTISPIVQHGKNGNALALLGNASIYYASEEFCLKNNLICGNSEFNQGHYVYNFYKKRHLVEYYFIDLSGAIVDHVRMRQLNS